MEDIQPGVAQAGEYLLQVSADQDRLRGDEVLAGEAASSVAVAATRGRHGGQCWKSGTSWSARFGWSMYPTVSGSNTRLDGTRERSSAAVLVLPQPKVPFSQMITWSCYERTHSPAVDGPARVTVIGSGEEWQASQHACAERPRRLSRNGHYRLDVNHKRHHFLFCALVASGLVLPRIRVISRKVTRTTKATGTSSQPGIEAGPPTPSLNR
jgi:hypothetical protein